MEPALGNKKRKPGKKPNRTPLKLLVGAVLVALVLVPAVALGATSAPTDTQGLTSAQYAPGMYLANASDFASKEAADWDSAATIRIEMSEFMFTPDNLTLEAGKPYKLELVTVGAVKHEFTASDFFASSAWRKAESTESEVKAAYFREIEVFSGKQVDLYLVPITPGTYELVCEIEGHFEAGMHGTITVTGSAPTSPAPVYQPISQGPWIANGEALVSAADWDTMQTVTIELREFSFTPAQIVLEVNQPYKLEFRNLGAVKHEETAPVFFQTVAFRKVQDASGEFKLPTALEVETFAGKQSDLYLIPTQIGTYELVCEIEGHLEAGMHGTIEVRAASQAAAPTAAPTSAPEAQGAPAAAGSGDAGIVQDSGTGVSGPMAVLLVLVLAALVVGGARAVTAGWRRQ